MGLPPFPRILANAYVSAGRGSSHCQRPCRNTPSDRQSASDLTGTLWSSRPRCTIILYIVRDPDQPSDRAARPYWWVGREVGGPPWIKVPPPNRKSKHVHCTISARCVWCLVTSRSCMRSFSRQLGTYSTYNTFIPLHIGPLFSCGASEWHCGIWGKSLRIRRGTFPSQCIWIQ